MLLNRELRKGDKIICKSVEAVIDTIHIADYCKTKGNIDWVIIEFTDTNGVYRSWKSDVDGGSVELVSDSKDLLEEYYDPYTGRFGIPFDDIDGEKTLAILDLIGDGYALTSYTDEGGASYYTVYSLEDDSQGYQEISRCKGVLIDLFNSFGTKPFIKVSLDVYSVNMECQNIIDVVLEKSSHFSNNVDGYSISLVVENGYLKFIEVLNACA